MTARCILSALTVFLLGLGGAVAQEPKERPHSQKSQQAEAVLEREAEEMLAAVVRVRMKAITNARSNATLGSNREGTGVVIDERGHIVTIGYIVIEAESIGAGLPVRGWVSRPRNSTGTFSLHGCRREALQTRPGSGMGISS